MLEKFDKVGAEIPRETKRRLKSLLAQQGISISEWIRLVVQVYLSENDKEKDE